MPYLLNACYLVALLLISPWLLYKALTTGKYRRGLWSKLTGQIDRSASHPVSVSPGHPRVWFHGVSVGEIHLLRMIVGGFRRRHPDWQCVVSTTTDTGYQEACKHFPGLPVFFWPLDFTWAARRALEMVSPDLVVLAEGEIWPNFLLEAKRRGLVVAVVNGRVSPRSFHRYGLLQPVFRRLFGAIDLFAVQNEDYARCYVELGAPEERIGVTGSVKYDGAVALGRAGSVSDRSSPVALGRAGSVRDRSSPVANVPGSPEGLAHLLAVEPGDLIWIAGSTQSPEEEIALNVYRRLRLQFAELRLFLVPRQRDRFDEVANLLRRSGEPFVRRSRLITPITDKNAVVLVDTIGELGTLWGLADVAFVGGSLDGRRGGQNMIEPASYGAAILFGPHVWNFQETADRLVEEGAAVQVAHPGRLEIVLRRLLADPDERQRLGDAARRFVVEQQGATERTLDLLDNLIGRAPAEAEQVRLAG